VDVKGFREVAARLALTAESVKRVRQELRVDDQQALLNTSESRSNMLTEDAPESLDDPHRGR
jgi:hypothetical protein